MLFIHFLEKGKTRGEKKKDIKYKPKTTVLFTLVSSST